MLSLFALTTDLTPETYLSQNSPPLRQGATTFIEEAANDPDFNPFATKSKVVNDLQQVLFLSICFMKKGLFLFNFLSTLTLLKLQVVLKCLTDLCVSECRRATSARRCSKHKPDPAKSR